MNKFTVMARLTRSLRRYRSEEEGSILLFSLILLFMMVLVGGLAVDVMRHEEKRVLLQQTLDRSVLAAASLSQEHDPTAVVNDYFEKANLLEYLSGVDVSEGLNFRTVTADAQADAKPFFMHLMGIDKFEVAADSTADERISNVEVSLVLDISGSMNGSRINNLRPAARSFVDTVMNASDPGKVTMSIVPYSAQVNLGPDLMAQFNATKIHDYSYCLELPDSVFSTTTLSQSTSLVHNGHFDPFNNATTSSLFNCTHYTANHVNPISDNATSLKSTITNMVVGGNTSIDLGVKWGALLLDPASQGITAGLISRGKVAATYSNRPLDSGEIDTLKVLVVMTDGENTTEYKLKSPYNTAGLSNVWTTSGGTIYAFHDRASTTSDYFRISDGKWYTKPTGVTNMTWPAVFQKYTTYYVAYNMYARPLGGSTSTYENNMVSSVSSTKNTRLQQVCSAAREAGIVIYGIAFEAPSGGQTQIKNCATSDAHYFNASGLEISTVFNAIANQISYLRLTQ